MAAARLFIKVTNLRGIIRLETGLHNHYLKHACFQFQVIKINSKVKQFQSVGNRDLTGQVHALSFIWQLNVYMMLDIEMTYDLQLQLNDETHLSKKDIIPTN